MKFFYKNNGAVSVFLSIVLVPIIVISSIFVDVSRVKLAKAEVAAAGDLAMNTLMANYDTDLNDFYGLMASVQSMDEFYSEVEDYYKLSLTSQGINVDDAESYAESISGILSGDTDVADFLQISLMEGTNVSATPVTNANLANPAMMKNQVIEFMRFRSPINAASDLFQQLQDASDELEDTSENTQLLEDKQEFYEDENLALSRAYDIYIKMLSYEELGITPEYLEAMVADLNTYEEQYYKLHEEMIKNLFNTQDYNKQVFTRHTFDTEQTNSTYWSVCLAPQSEIERLEKKVATDMCNFILKVKKFETTCDEVSYEGSYNIQYWVQMLKKWKKTEAYKNLTDAGDKLCTDYAALENAVEYAEGGVMSKKYDLTQKDGVNTYGVKTLQEHYDALKEQYESVFETCVGSGTTYDTVCGRLGSISGDANAHSTTDTTAAGAELLRLNNKMKEYKKKMEDGMSILTDVRKDLLELKKEMEDCRESFSDWKTDADTYTDNDVAESDRKEINEIDQEFMEMLTTENLDAFYNRLNCINGLLGAYKIGIGEYKYRDTAVIDIDSYADFKAASKVSENQIDVREAVLNKYVQNFYQFTNSEQIEKIGITDNNNPSLDVATPEVYAWMKNKFREVTSKTSEEYDKHKQEAEDKEEEAEEATSEENSSNTNEISGEANLPSAESMEMLDDTSDAIGSMTTDLSKTSNLISGLFTDFTGTLQKGATSIRDDLYTIDYITSMFTYDTYEKEVKKGDRTSLTNKEMNETNNWSYQNEVEYIMYGGSNAANKASSYGTIFLIRFALNLPADVKYYMDKETMGGWAVWGVATAIADMTGGIVPIGLARLAIVLGLTIAESTYDISQLKEGKKVLLLKGEEDLKVSFNDGTNTIEDKSAGDSGTEEKSGFYMGYCDYLKVLLFAKLQTEDGENAIYKRIADVVQVNTAKRTGEEYKLSDAVVYYKIEAEFEVAPIVLGWKLIKDEPGNPYQEISWRSFKYSTTKGY